MKTIAWSTTALMIFAFACSRSDDSEYADRMAEEHRDDVPIENRASARQPSHDVTTERVVYATLAGHEVEGLLARPEGLEAQAPGIIVIHEWWGLNENVESMAMRLAGEGYTALAVDLYGGNVAADRDAARALMSAAMEDRSTSEDNLRQAYAFLEEAGATRIGSIGWCFGGGWSLATALLHPHDLDAAVIYYGRLVTDPELLAPLDVPILGIFGSEDQGIPVASVREFEAALVELGKDPIIHIYDGADHAFANPSGTRYQQAAAEDAWKQTLTFFDRHLKTEVAASELD